MMRTRPRGLVVRMQRHQIAARASYLLGLGVVVHRHTCQDVGLELAYGRQKLDTGEVAVTQHKHAWLYRAQHAGSQALFTDSTGSQGGIDDGMSTGFR